MVKVVSIDLRPLSKRIHTAEDEAYDEVASDSASDSADNARRNSPLTATAASYRGACTVDDLPIHQVACLGGNGGTNGIASTALAVTVQGTAALLRKCEANGDPDQCGSDNKEEEGEDVEEGGEGAGERREEKGWHINGSACNGAYLREPPHHQQNRRPPSSHCVTLEAILGRDIECVAAHKLCANVAFAVTRRSLSTSRNEKVAKASPEAITAVQPAKGSYSSSQSQSRKCCSQNRGWGFLTQWRDSLLGAPSTPQLLSRSAPSSRLQNDQHRNGSALVSLGPLSRLIDGAERCGGADCGASEYYSCGGYDAAKSLSLFPQQQQPPPPPPPPPLLQKWTIEAAAHPMQVWVARRGTAGVGMGLVWKIDARMALGRGSGGSEGDCRKSGGHAHRPLFSLPSIPSLTSRRRASGGASRSCCPSVDALCQSGNATIESPYLLVASRGRVLVFDERQPSAPIDWWCQPIEGGGSGGNSAAAVAEAYMRNTRSVLEWAVRCDDGNLKIDSDDLFSDHVALSYGPNSPLVAVHEVPSPPVAATSTAYYCGGGDGRPNVGSVLGRTHHARTAEVAAVVETVASFGGDTGISDEEDLEEDEKDDGDRSLVGRRGATTSTTTTTPTLSLSVSQSGSTSTSQTHPSFRKLSLADKAFPTQSLGSSLPLGSPGRWGLGLASATGSGTGETLMGAIPRADPMVPLFGAAAVVVTSEAHEIIDNPPGSGGAPSQRWQKWVAVVQMTVAGDVFVSVQSGKRHLDNTNGNKGRKKRARGSGGSKRGEERRTVGVMVESDAAHDYRDVAGSSFTAVGLHGCRGALDVQPHKRLRVAISKSNDASPVPLHHYLRTFLLRHY